jgi:carbonic anhydrase/acetyltransferase-like protein (isoleucine patch superfamily)
MKHLEKLVDRIIDRVNINLRRHPSMDVGPYVRELIPMGQFVRFYAFYGLTLHHPLHFHFNHSSLAGSYFLGKCHIDHSILYKSDIRGDELKCKGDILKCGDIEIPLHDDEIIRIKDSYLIKNLVHNNSHDPETPEEFLIQNTASMHYANIHGSQVEGAFMGPFSTVDLTTVRSCGIGTYAYVQTGELSHQRVDDGQIWIRSEDAFSFQYLFNPEDLRQYIRLEPGKNPEGLFMDFVEERKADFESSFDVVQLKHPIPVPHGASLSRYAIVKGDTHISENVLVAQRAYLEDAWLGKGSNAQENCYIIKSYLEGCNITAHGGKIIHARLGEKVFVGFNGFLRGTPECPLTIGKGCIIMPHTIIDLKEPLDIPPDHLVWGYIRNKRSLERHSMPLEKLAKSEGGEIAQGAMIFQGSGSIFVEAFQHRIEHILEANGAYFDGHKNRGHAQKVHHISFNIIQPYPAGTLKGLYPTIDISLPLMPLMQKSSIGRCI